MPASNSGTEVLSYCGSCKMDLMAVIIAKVGAKIAKVQCKTCRKERAYRQPKGVTEPGMTPPKASRKSSKESEPAARPIEAEWQRLMGEATAANRVKYSPKTKLSPGDVVQHPTFGEGIVMRVSHPDKAEILFRTDVKLLIHSRL